MTDIFNRIIDSGKFPKNARVTHVHKIGDKMEATLYRPIFVLSNDKIDRTTYIKYLTNFNLLHSSQSGFRPYHSCQSALINITDKWLKAMNDGNINGVVFLDLK